MKLKKNRKTRKPYKMKGGERKQIVNEIGRYEGDVIDDKKEGYGIMDYADTRKYVGQWKNDQMEGNGRMIYPDKSIYAGQWKNSQKHGKGILFDRYGVVEFNGEWNMGELVESNIYSPNDLPDKKIITILIRAHGSDLLTPDIPRDPLYPNAESNVNVRILSQAGNTCSNSLTSNLMGNKNASFGNNIIDLFEMNPQLTTFEILSKYALDPTRLKYSKLMARYPIRTDGKGVDRQTLQDAQQYKNFVLFNPIMDHKYTFNDHNEALQNNAGIYVLNIQNFDDSGLSKDIETMPLSNFNSMEFLEIIFKWLKTPNTAYKGHTSLARLEHIGGKIIINWRRLLTRLRINSIEKFISRCKTENELCIEDNGFNEDGSVKDGYNIAEIVRNSIDTPKKEEELIEYLTIKFKENILHAANILNEMIKDTPYERYNMLRLMDIVDRLHITYGFDVVNIIDLSCRSYDFDDWTTIGPDGTPVKYTPSYEEMDEFIETVRQNEDDAKKTIDPRYGGMVKWREKAKAKAKTRTKTKKRQIKFNK